MSLVLSPVTGCGTHRDRGHGRVRRRACAVSSVCAKLPGETCRRQLVVRAWGGGERALANLTHVSERARPIEMDTAWTGADPPPAGVCSE